MTSDNKPLDTRPAAVVADLVRAGLVDSGRSAEAEAVVARALSGGTRTVTPLRRRIAEIAGYVGAAFVLGAAFLLSEIQPFFEVASIGKDPHIMILRQLLTQILQRRLIACPQSRGIACGQQ